jgi:hypothetical protein
MTEFIENVFNVILPEIYKLWSEVYNVWHTKL